MKFIKDLLYTKGNQALDISRVCSLASVVAFWVGVFLDKIEGDALVVGGGCAAIMAGAAGWIHFRQKHEEGSE